MMVGSQAAGGSALRRMRWALCGVGLVWGAWAAADRAGEAKEKPQTITGEVVDVLCWYKEGLKGPGHRSCAEKCGEMGHPMGILVTKSQRETLYIALAPTEAKLVNAILLPYAAQEVKVTGKIIKRGQSQAIWIEKVEASPRQ